MNIDELTLGQIKELTKFFPIKSEINIAKKSHPMIGKHCIIRTYSAGVHFGIVKDVDNKAGGQGCDVLLENSRRIWKWEGAFTLSEVAQAGVNSSSRIASEVPETYICGVIEMIPTTESARKKFAACNDK